NRQNLAATEMHCARRAVQQPGRITLPKSYLPRNTLKTLNHRRGAGDKRPGRSRFPQSTSTTKYTEDTKSGARAPSPAPSGDSPTEIGKSRSDGNALRKTRCVSTRTGRASPKAHPPRNALKTRKGERGRPRLHRPATRRTEIGKSRTDGNALARDAQRIDQDGSRYLKHIYHGIPEDTEPSAGRRRQATGTVALSPKHIH